MGTKREFFDSFNIAGFTYYDGPFFFDELKIGTKLNIQRDKKNKYDPQAIKILFEDVKIGYVPRVSNAIIYKLLKMGFKNFECIIQRKDPQAHSENQIYVAIYLVKPKKEPKEKTIIIA